MTNKIGLCTFCYRYTDNTGCRCQGFPCVYILCVSHQTSDYLLCFDIVNRQLTKKKFVSALCDFERGFATALIRSNLVTRVYGCLFHLNQAIGRKFCTNFKKLYYNSRQNLNIVFREQMEMIWILAYVPKKQFSYAYSIFSRGLKKVCHDNNLHNEYIEFKSYLDKTWFGANSMFPIQVWNCSDRIFYKFKGIPRPFKIIPETSNNRLEATNNFLNRTIGIKRNCLMWMENLCFIENQTQLNYRDAMYSFPHKLKKVQMTTQNKEKRICFFINQIRELHIKQTNGIPNEDDLDELNDLLKEMTITQARHRKNYANIKSSHNPSYR